MQIPPFSFALRNAKASAMTHFTSFSCIDWSGARSRWHKGIAVALCKNGQAAPALVPPLERHWTRAAILDWLREQAVAKCNMLIGLDLSFGLPFVDQQAFFPEWPDSPTTAKALWETIDRICADDSYLAATSFVNHSEARRHFRHSKNEIGNLFSGGIGRLRLVEHHQRETKQANSASCFNLVGAAQVGKSSLTGMRVLHRLNGAIPVWPFDPVPDRGPVIVEIYTSIAARASGVLPRGKSKITDGATLDAALQRFQSDAHAPTSDKYTDHATDAILTAAWLRHEARNTAFWYPQKLSAKIAQTEGWTFGVS